jgi:hypothetical protein
VVARTKHFIRHYLEMVAAMFVGMLVLGAPSVWALGAVGSGTSELQAEAPAVLLLGMAVTMTVPMVAWMRYRGHGWRPCNEMSAAMFVPTFVAIALLGVAEFDTLMTFEHVAMLLAMLVAMLLRPAEYSHPDHAHATV